MVLVDPLSKRPALDRSRPAVLQAATRLLLESPELSLGELAVRIGISRTTLHRMFPTREAVLRAVAHEAIDHLVVAYTEAGLDPARPDPTRPDPSPPSATARRIRWHRSGGWRRCWCLSVRS